MHEWFNAKREKGAKSATIRIYDQIGKDWFGEGTNAKEFVTAVDDLGDDLDTLNVHINSPGGNVYDGLAIHNYLKRHSAEVVVYIDGIAASIASVIAMAGDLIVMPENSSLFIHNPWTFAGGDAAALRKTADELDAIRSSLLSTYMAHTNLPMETVVEMMDEETYISAEDAVSWGFADELEEASKMAASVRGPEVVAAAKMQAQHEAARRALDVENSKLRDELQALSDLHETVVEQYGEALDAIAALEDEVKKGARPAPPMAAEDVITAVQAAKAPDWLATACISAGEDELTVQHEIAEYTAINDVCVAAGLSLPDALFRDHWSEKAGLISALLIEALAENEEAINSRAEVDSKPEAKVDYFKAYASRKPKTHH